MEVTTRTSPADGAHGSADRPRALHTRLEFEIAGGEQAPRIARQVVHSLRTELDGQRLNEVRLLVTELVTNCVQHAHIGRTETVTVSVELDKSTLHVAVSNPGAGFEPPRPAAGDSEGGRGLVIVDQLAERWGVDDVHEARVWFEISRSANGNGGPP